MNLTDLEAVLASRVGSDPSESYTARLLADHELTQRKIMEEAFEVCLELQRSAKVHAPASDPASDGDGGRVAEEAADLIYHLMVGLVGAGVSIGDVIEVLEGRRA